MYQEEILLARQPIFDSRLNIFAYELLFRPDIKGPQLNLETEGDQATSLVMLNAFTEVGIQNVVGDHKAFINFTRNLILKPPPFTSQEIVIEVLENIQPEPEIIDSLEKLKASGYTIALDDFIYHESLQPLIDIADIIKVDVLSLSMEELAEHARILKTTGSSLLAEKVENQEMYEICKELGFDYFQGYFLSKPKLVKGRKIPSNKLVVMKLIAELQSPDTNPQKLHDTIAQDPGLSFKLLRLINSAAYRRPNKIESLYRAILLIGLSHIKRWASMLALTNLDDKPNALHEQTMLRAKMCELLGQKIDSKQADLFYTVGMLSMLDAYFDSSLEELLTSISLTDEINDALLHHAGVLGFVLGTCKAYERGEWGNIDWQGLHIHSLNIQDIKTAYVDSLHWMSETGAAMLSSIER